MSASASKLVALAKLATCPGTNENERASAARTLAQHIARDGLPATSRREDPLGAILGVDALTRERDALAAIALERKAEIESLRADKADLEERLRAKGSRKIRRDLEGSRALRRESQRVVDGAIVRVEPTR